MATAACADAFPERAFHVAEAIATVSSAKRTPIVRIKLLLHANTTQKKMLIVRISVSSSVCVAMEHKKAVKNVTTATTLTATAVHALVWPSSAAMMRCSRRWERRAIMAVSVIRIRVFPVVSMMTAASAIAFPVRMFLAAAEPEMENSAQQMRIAQKKHSLPVSTTRRMTFHARQIAEKISAETVRLTREKPVPLVRRMPAAASDKSVAKICVSLPDNVSVRNATMMVFATQMSLAVVPTVTVNRAAVHPASSVRTSSAHSLSVGMGL